MKDLKISETKFFPKPNAIFKEVKKFSNDYWKGWGFNGLFVVASAAIMQHGTDGFFQRSGK